MSGGELGDGGTAKMMEKERRRQGIRGGAVKGMDAFKRSRFASLITGINYIHAPTPS